MKTRVLVSAAALTIAVAAVIAVVALAASLGLSRMFDDDLQQLEAGMMLYDAFYRWCRDASGETHNWPTNKAKP